MSNVDLVIEEREANIGNFMVGRLLPFRKKRSVGPFVFIDHMGPEILKKGDSLQVGPHPHIGLSTLTFLFDGQIQHKDTTGANMVIEPGAVNWMTAGKGVVHSERSPKTFIDHEQLLHGLQIWVALPKELENMDPFFQHVEANDIPNWSDHGIYFRLIAGEVADFKSPVKVFSKLYMLEVFSEEEKSLNLGEILYGESGMYILEGNVTIEGNTFGPKQILIKDDASLCEFTIHKGTKLYIFGGEVFTEERHIFWNFVSSDQDKIEKAKNDWMHKRFPLLKGEDDCVPIPNFPFIES